jgi:hypothetical protein
MRHRDSVAAPATSRTRRTGTARRHSSGVVRRFPAAIYLCTNANGPQFPENGSRVRSGKAFSIGRMPLPPENLAPTTADRANRSPARQVPASAGFEGAHPGREEGGCGAFVPIRKVFALFASICPPGGAVKQGGTGGRKRVHGPAQGVAGSRPGPSAVLIRNRHPSPPPACGTAPDWHAAACSRRPPCVHCGSAGAAAGHR